ncbi:HNH endonuclease [Virgibacillus halodenitrificans]|uniref:HNH endonuclease n=1 Tax=Virgibacillus halodenitrificans TaxID=1482 RepID=UPI002DBC4D80|nr:HNH endonuclease [Virgibacillus halodenitrificans]MEC2158003.1 HNH endonuclease [Virgibacillus halodenitrificans]
MNNYKLLFEPITYPIEYTSDEEVRAVFKGDRKNRKCAYCGKGNGEVTFKKDAHIIPASLGNRVFYNYDECDHCNEYYFGVQENELANFLMLDRIFIGAKKRKGLPKYKPISKGTTSIERVGNSNTVSMKIDDLEERFEIVDDEPNKQMVFKINKPLPYRPADICKALTHMIWPFLPEEKKNILEHIPKWLLRENDIFPLHLDIAFVPGNGYSNVILECWESDSPEYPFIVRFTFGLKILSFYIPSSTDVSVKPDRHIDYFQIPEDIEIEGEGMSILNNDRLKPGFLSYTINYSKKE